MTTLKTKITEPVTASMTYAPAGLGPVTIGARPHRNGNTPESFRRAAQAIDTAAQDLEKACREHLSEITHGRNYQHLTEGDAQVARQRDLETVNREVRGVHRAQALAYAVLAAGDPQ